MEDGYRNVIIQHNDSVAQLQKLADEKYYKHTKQPQIIDNDFVLPEVTDIDFIKIPDSLKRKK